MSLLLLIHPFDSEPITQEQMAKQRGEAERVAEVIHQIDVIGTCCCTSDAEDRHGGKNHVDGATAGEREAVFNRYDQAVEGEKAII